MTDQSGRNADGAAQRRRQLQVGIPERLERLADELADCLALLARAGLSEALQPDPTRHQAVPGQLRDAATRVRWAAALLPATVTWTPTAAAGGRLDTPDRRSVLDITSNLGC
jgi:hypothetical protein